MKCLYPHVIFTGGTAGDLFRPFIEVPCGKCIACRINRRREWTQRLLHESYCSSTSYFITLTYDEEHLPIDDNGNNAVSKVDVQKFMKRLRKTYTNVTIRFFIGSEYGPETGRPHYHGILYNVPEDVLSDSKNFIKGMARFDKDHNRINSKLNDIWQNGTTTIASINRERCGYCAKYFVDKKEVPEEITPNFSLMSRKPGLGYQHSQSIKEKVRYYGQHSMMTDNGKYIGLPRYYKNKIYTEDEIQAMSEKFKNEFVDNITQEDTDYIVNARIIAENIKRAMTIKGYKSKL